MSLRKIFTIMFLVSLLSNVTKSSEPLNPNENYYYTGNLKIDLFAETLLSNFESTRFENQGENIFNGSKKSPFLAAGLSFIIPGAGEIYSESYIKGGVFLAVEIAAWTYSLHYENKGDKQNSLFENFADERFDTRPTWDITEPDRYRTRWDVIRYYEWSNQNKAVINPQGDFSNLQNAVISNDKSLPPWERVDWKRLNELERAIGKWYSHTLPKHGEQQYYELIGKYQQYNQGWFDAKDSNYTYGPVTETFKYYSSLRGLANDYYYKAKTAMVVVLANHVISAIDAYFTANRYNSKFKAEANMDIMDTPFGQIPTASATIKYEF